MVDLATHVRTMQLFYHQAHHLVKGEAFGSDHKLFNSFYKELDDSYDSIAERTIMLLGSNAINLPDQVSQITHKLAILPPLNQLQHNRDFFQIGLMLEKELCGRCAAHFQVQITEGTKNLLAQLCDESEQRQYKIQQRIK